MVCDAMCAYRESKLSLRTLAAFIDRSKDHIAFAAGINVFVSYFFQTDVKIAFLQGTLTAVAFNVAHYISHHVPGKETEEMRAALTLTGVFLITIYFFPNIAIYFERKVTFYQSLNYGMISWISIAFCNQFYY